MNQDIKVSVLCTAYNHEKFLRKCLDGFVNQKTNFKFEVIVHDDASTDGTKAVIEEYVNKYPDLIIPIYQTENQYSKKVEIIDDIMFPISKGKYIAICEGDDYWCDENKLQLQYDFMESHPECSACFHNTLVKNYINHREKLINNWTNIYYLNPMDVFYLKVHTSSYFTRREYFQKEEYQRGYWFGDLVMLTKWMTYGKLAVLPQVMSVYGVGHNEYSLIYRYNQSDVNTRIEKMKLIAQYFDIFNKKNNYIYDKEIKNYIDNLNFNIKLEYFAFHKFTTSKEFYHFRKEIKIDNKYKGLYKDKNLFSKIKLLIKFNAPLFVLKVLYKFKRKNGK